MNNESLQQTLLMAQLDKKRAMKQKYLRENVARGQENSPVTELVMTNVMLMAVRKRVDVFSILRKFRAEPSPSFGRVMSWLGELAELLDCGVYEFFVEDKPRQQRTVTRLLQELERCDSWENIRTVEGGGGSFVLVGFDYAYRMAERPSSSLLFEKTPVESGFRYTLTLGDGRDDLSGVPGHGVLWREEQGSLQQFADRVLAEANSGWGRLKAQLELVQRPIQQEAETLRDLLQVLKEVPTGLDVTSLLIRSTRRLQKLRQQVSLIYGEMPGGMKQSGRGKGIQNTLFLLGAAVSSLERITRSGADPAAETLEEVVYLLENACQPI